NDWIDTQGLAGWSGSLAVWGKAGDDVFLGIPAASLMDFGTGKDQLFRCSVQASGGFTYRLKVGGTLWKLTPGTPGNLQIGYNIKAVATGSDQWGRSNSLFLLTNDGIMTEYGESRLWPQTNVSQLLMTSNADGQPAVVMFYPSAGSAQMYSQSGWQDLAPAGN